MAEFGAKAIDIAGHRHHHTETSKFGRRPDLDPRDGPLLLGIAGGGGSDPSPGGRGYGNSPGGAGSRRVICTIRVLQAFTEE